MGKYENIAKKNIGNMLNNAEQLMTLSERLNEYMSALSATAAVTSLRSLSYNVLSSTTTICEECKIIYDLLSDSSANNLILHTARAKDKMEMLKKLEQPNENLSFSSPNINLPTVRNDKFNVKLKE